MVQPARKTYPKGWQWKFRERAWNVLLWDCIRSHLDIITVYICYVLTMYQAPFVENILQELIFVILKRVMQGFRWDWDLTKELRTWPKSQSLWNAGVRIWMTSGPEYHSSHNLCGAEHSRPGPSKPGSRIALSHYAMHYPIIKLKKASEHPQNMQSWKEECVDFAGENVRFSEGDINNKNHQV